MYIYIPKRTCTTTIILTPMYKFAKNAYKTVTALKEWPAFFYPFTSFVPPAFVWGKKIRFAFSWYSWGAIYPLQQKIEMEKEIGKLRYNCTKNVAQIWAEKSIRFSTPTTSQVILKYKYIIDNTQVLYNQTL